MGNSIQSTYSRRPILLANGHQLLAAPESCSSDPGDAEVRGSLGIRSSSEIVEIGG